MLSYFLSIRRSLPDPGAKLRQIGLDLVLVRTQRRPLFVVDAVLESAAGTARSAA